MKLKILCVCVFVFLPSGLVAMMSGSKHMTDSVWNQKEEILKEDLEKMTKKFNPEPDTFSFDILHFNDAYDIFKSSYFMAQWDKLSASNPLKFFSGDLYSPSDLSIEEGGQQFIPFQKLAKIDAGVVGNHEFDYGEKRFKELLEMAKKENQKPFWINSNVFHLKETKESERKTYGEIPEFRIFKTGQNGEVVVGVIGLADKNWITSSHLKEGTFDLVDPIARAKKYIRFLKNNLGVHIVIALTHMNNNSDMELLREVKEIDFVLGGHEHLYYYAQVDGRFVIKSGVDFGHFSKIKIHKSAEPIKSTFKDGKEFNLDKIDNPRDRISQIHIAIPRGGDFLNVEIERVEVLMDQNGEKHEEMEKELKKLRTKLSFLDIPAFVLEAPLDTTEETVRSGETTICQLVTDVLRLEAKTDIAMLNSGGFRLNNRMEAGSVITWGIMKRLLPFPDTIEKISLTYDEVIEFLEDGLEAYLGVSRKPIMNVSGITCKFDETKDYPHRVVHGSVLINGQSLVRDRIYTIAVTKFIGEGKDGFNVFSHVANDRGIISDLTPMNVMINAWSVPAGESDPRKAKFIEFKANHPHLTVADLYDRPDDDEKKVQESPDPLVKEEYLRNFKESLNVGIPLLRRKTDTFMTEPHQTSKFLPMRSDENVFNTLFTGITKVDGRDVFKFDPSPNKPRIQSLLGRALKDFRPMEEPLEVGKVEKKRLL